MRIVEGASGGPWAGLNLSFPHGCISGTTALMGRQMAYGGYSYNLSAALLRFGICVGSDGFGKREAEARGNASIHRL
jgi:hypothetical protein